MAERNRWALALQNAPLVLRGIYEYNIASRFGPLRPREWVFPLTYRCDARCIMCNIWQGSKTGELSLDEWRDILNDPLFAGIESVTLTGGEPTLHPELLQLMELLMDKLPSLQRLTLNTNGLGTKRVVEQCEELLDLCTARGIRLFAAISLDSIGPLHDEMRNIPGAFDKVQQTLEELQRLRAGGLRRGISCLLTNRNLHDAENVRQWSAERGLGVYYMIAAFTESYYANTDRADDLAFTVQQREDLAAFLQKLATEKSLLNPVAYWYADLARMIERGAPRATPCIFQKDAFMLDARGDFQWCMYSRALGNVRQKSTTAIYYAPDSLAHRRELWAQSCRQCTIGCSITLALAKDAFKYARFLLGGKP